MEARHDPMPVITAIVIATICLTAGAILGSVIGAGRSGGVAITVEQDIADPEKAFNWLIFSIFAAAGLVGAAIGYVGTSISVTVRAAARMLAQPPA